MHWLGQHQRSATVGNAEGSRRTVKRRTKYFDMNSECSQNRRAAIVKVAALTFRVMSVMAMLRQLPGQKTPYGIATDAECSQSCASALGQHE
jgi:hypothetical protein